MSADLKRPFHQFPTVRQFMTLAPHTIARHRSLADARQIMRAQHVRHLPVLDGGVVVGMLSERDLLMVEALPGLNPAAVRVEEAMVQDLFSVPPETPVAEAIETMIDRKLGSAVVCEGERVLGVFTTIDALRALHRELEAPLDLG